eukprot:9204446-Alexandrium_andersonii.AAC.1
MACRKASSAAGLTPTGAFDAWGGPTVMGRNNYTLAGPSGQGEPGAPSPARGGVGPSTPDGPTSPLCGWEPAKGSRRAP